MHKGRRLTVQLWWRGVAVNHHRYSNNTLGNDLHDTLQ